MPQARPTQAICVTATTDADIAVDPDSEYLAIHHTIESAIGGPKATNWRQRPTTEMVQLNGTALHDTLPPQTIERARRATRLALPDHHTPGSGVPNQGGTLPRLPNTHNANQPGASTAYWSFSTAAGMVAQVAEPTLPPSVTALTKAVQAMARREGAPLEWTPNTVVEQCIHHSTNRTQQTGHQIHPPLWDKDNKLQPHSQCMVHYILEDYSANQKGTKVQLTQNWAQTHLQYTIPASNALVNQNTAQQSTYRKGPDTERPA